MSSFPVARRFKRRPCDTKAAVLWQGQFSFESGVDLSEGGMRSHKHFHLSTELEVNFVVPGGGFVSSRARVVFVRPEDDGTFSYGLEFIDPSTTLKEEVRSFVETSL